MEQKSSSIDNKFKRYFKINTYQIALVLGSLLCSMVAGFLFAYLIVIMPGLKKLKDKEFIQAFQVTDRIIQDNNPLFIFVWLGSAISVIVCAVSGLGNLEGANFVILLTATVAYLIGVQALTIFINLPLNSQLQDIDIEAMDDEGLRIAREKFENRWNSANLVRTIIATLVSVLLILLSLRN